MNAENRKSHLIQWPEHEVEMVFRWIPNGRFRMGSNGYYRDEQPIHEIEIVEDFWLGETLVTRGQFRIWMQAEGKDHEYNFYGPETDKHPAAGMIWYHAVRFCEWLTLTKGKEFPEGYGLACLPTEAEWEYACRAGSETNYYNGDAESDLAAVGWYYKNSSQNSQPVAAKYSNNFGLFDMHGNVEEWCHDIFDKKAYRKRRDGESDPGWKQRNQDYLKVVEWEQDERCRSRRGGSWGSAAKLCRSAYRCEGSPDDWFWFHGFRVCLIRWPAATNV